MSVLFNNSQKVLSVLSDSVRALAEFVLDQEDASEKEVSVLFVDDAAITELNARHLGRNRPTDVIAFPMTGDASVSIHPEILGDVVVSVERALRYAEQHVLTVQHELSLYLVHGILHLLGYDDIAKPDNTRMRRREKELLSRAEQQEMLVKTR